MNQDKLSLLQQNKVMQDRAEKIHQLLTTIPGEDADREGLKETPWRVAKMYDELFWGYTVDAEQILRDAMFSDVHSEDLVIVKDIPFYSMCEHHMMPFFGTVSIAYVPQDGVIVGLSKLARLVDVFARRLQVQERMCQEILRTIKKVMNPFGIAVIIKAEHTCMTARGVLKPGTQTVTSALDGLFKLDDKARSELMNLLKF